MYFSNKSGKKISVFTLSSSFQVAPSVIELLRLETDVLKLFSDSCKIERFGKKTKFQRRLIFLKSISKNS